MSPNLMIATARRVEYALGFVQLNLLTEAAHELDAIPWEDRFSAEVVAARIELHMASKHWDTVVSYATILAQQEPDNVHGWISWAFALRELLRFKEARDVLLEAEPRHGTTTAVLHYNLACYYCLMGDIKTAQARLATACRMEASWKTEALTDLDLAAMPPEVGFKA
jgi:predicted Zn-dependent protease